MWCLGYERNISGEGEDGFIYGIIFLVCERVGGLWNVEEIR